VLPQGHPRLLTTAREYGHSLEIVASAERINDAQKLVLVRKLRKHLDNDLAGKTFGVWGLAFKPNTDDIREAPALKIVRTLVADGAKIRMHDPEAGPNFLASLGGNIAESCTLVDDPYEAAEGAHALLLVTEWREYRSPDFERLKRSWPAPPCSTAATSGTAPSSRTSGSSTPASAADHPSRAASHDRDVRELCR
jgi:UDPglucose 6-dehydrogenase